MAKQESFAGVVSSQPAAPVEDVAALKLRIAELEAQLAIKAPAPPLPSVPGPLRKFHVELMGAPSVVLMAVDSANAWATYMAQVGCTGSQNIPQVSECDQNAPLTYPHHPTNKG